jgi:hypothetical protein
MRVTVAEWKPINIDNKGRKSSGCSLVLRNMDIGECKRIEHTEILCDFRHGKCSLLQIAWSIKKKLGYKYQMYHESNNIAVVRRIE